MNSRRATPTLGLFSGSTRWHAQANEPRQPGSGSGDLFARMFVGATFLAMLLIALACIALYGRNVPLSEDWFIVPPLTGNERDFGAWLWAANAEHRVPLPKLVLLGLVKLAQGDFRAGMLLNVLLLAGLALAMILIIRRLRGGRTSYADAFFPLAFLHLGNWENMFWSWQLQFVLSTALTCVLLLVLVVRGERLSVRACFVAGTCLMLLPLSGANGLVLLPFLVVAAAYEGVRGLRSGVSGRPRLAIWFLVGSAATSVIVGALYFVGFERPDWSGPSPGARGMAVASGKFLSYALGSSLARIWKVKMLFVALLLGASIYLLVAAVLRSRGAPRQRAFGLLLFVGGLVSLVLALGWGRGGPASPEGLPQRYVLLAVPVLVVVYFVWELYGSERGKRAAQALLFVAFVALLPFNTNTGLQWRNWYVHGMNAFEHDVDAGVPIPVLAERHREFLLHWSEATLAADMTMLREAGLGPLGHAVSGAAACLHQGRHGPHAQPDGSGGEVCPLVSRSGTMVAGGPPR